MNNGQVSIIAPSHQSAKFVSQTIESLLIQSYQNGAMIL